LDQLFSDLDKSMESLRTVHAELTAYRQAVLKHAFEGKLSATWRARNPKRLETAAQMHTRLGTAAESACQRGSLELSSAARQRKAKGAANPTSRKPRPSILCPPLDQATGPHILPHGWNWVPLSWMLSKSKKPMSTGPFGTMLKKHEHQASGIPVLGIENIGRGRFLPGNKIFITAAKYQELKAFEVEAGDLLISRSGTVGEICEVPPGLGTALISTNLIRVSLDQRVISPAFFVHMFQGGGSVRSQVKELCKGSSREFLTPSLRMTCSTARKKSQTSIKGQSCALMRRAMEGSNGLYLRNTMIRCSA
jgi:type I restriction enzyme, S subunit